MIFLEDPLIKSFGSICPAFLVSLWSSKENCVLYFVGNKAKGRISKRVFQESKGRQNFRKKHFLLPDTQCAYQGVRNVCFSEILACFAFLKRLFWDSPFCLIYYRRFKLISERILLDMHEKSFEKIRQKYFDSICKCTVVFKLKTLNLQMFSKYARLYVQMFVFFRTIRIACFY